MGSPIAFFRSLRKVRSVMHRHDLFYVPGLGFGGFDFIQCPILVCTYSYESDISLSMTHCVVPKKKCYTQSSPLMLLSHLPRFDHDCYRGLHRGPIGTMGTIVSNLIRSHHILISIVIIGLIVEKFLAAKNFATITPIGGIIVTIASDRMTS